MTLSPVPYSDRPLPATLPGLSRDEASLRALICHTGRLMSQAHYIDGETGHISARLDAQRLLVTPAELALGFLQPDHLIVIDLDGKQIAPAVDNNRHLRPTPELIAHLECYRQRPDLYGMIHAHPPTAIALTIAGVSMRTCVLPEAVITLGLVPTAAYSAPASSEERAAIRALIAQHDALMLAYHGSLTVGSDVWQAYLKLETLEHLALVLHRAAQFGPIRPLPPDEVARLLDMRRQAGYWRPGDEERFCEACGAC